MVANSKLLENWFGSYHTDSNNPEMELLQDLNQSVWHRLSKLMNFFNQFILIIEEKGLVKYQNIFIAQRENQTNKVMLEVLEV